MCCEDRRRCPSGEDRISLLPDELLHGILVRLGCARAAARTSVLSRRWRHVWAHLPELVLLDGGRHASSFLDTVDGALAGYSAPTLDRLSISLTARHGHCVPARRVQPWLRFASKRVVGALYLCLYTLPPPPPPPWASSGSLPVMLEPPGRRAYVGVKVKEVLRLPASKGVTKILLRLQRGWHLRPPFGGVFAALTSLTIKGGRMAGSDLTALVCTQCPRLRDLTLSMTLAAASDVSLSSDSLRSLELDISIAWRLEVVAPRLEELTVDDAAGAVHICAPNLAKLAWRGRAYYPQYDQLADVGRRLRRLEISRYSAVASLIQQFDEVDELQLQIHIAQGTAGYESFLNGTDKLPKCNTLTIVLLWDYHDLLSFMLHLLRSCNGARKISLLFADSWNRPSRYSCPPSCRCRLKESRKIDGLILSSLEEVEISGFTDSQEKHEFLQFLSSNATILKKLVINYTVHPAAPLTEEVCKKVRSMCRPNVRAEFYSFSDGKWVCFD
ncbi:hypothetical protein BS78_05G177300 [Paspalum vaginatum]|nr:hypothetical protein BS78_05G177300 [Paspalum vaginatum]